MNTLDDFNEIDHDAVLDALFDKGLTLSWEFPGCAVIDVTPTIQAWTGLHSYAYGSLSQLVDDGWQPMEDVPAEPEGLEEYETDPERIAAAWAAWVANYREEHP